MFINNTTSCNYTVDIYWTDGAIFPAAPTCTTSLGVNINAYSSFTVTNPLSGTNPTATYVVVHDNTCLNNPIIGKCNINNCYSCQYVSNYIDYNCTLCGTPILHFQFIAKSGGTNAQLYIHN